MFVHCVPMEKVKECIINSVFNDRWYCAPDSGQIVEEEVCFEMDVDIMIDEMDNGLSGFMTESYPFLAITLLTG